MFLSNDDSEVVGLARGVVAYWSETNSLGVVCIIYERGIARFLKLHFADINVSSGSIRRVLNLRKLIGNYVSNVHYPRRLYFRDEVRMRVFEDIYVKV